MVNNYIPNNQLKLHTSHHLAINALVLLVRKRYNKLILNLL